MCSSTFILSVLERWRRATRRSLWVAAGPQLLSTAACMAPYGIVIYCMYHRTKQKDKLKPADKHLLPIPTTYYKQLFRRWCVEHESGLSGSRRSGLPRYLILMTLERRVCHILSYERCIVLYWSTWAETTVCADVPNHQKQAANPPRLVTSYRHQASTMS